MKATNILSVLAFLFSATVLFAGTTGKITGVVTDAKTGEKLISANIVIEGTTMGAATNLDGYFVILNVSPGTYRLKASLLGFTSSTLVDVRVIIDQTTNVSIGLNESSLTTQEVIIVAQRPVVQKDVSSSQTNLNFKEFQNLPAVQTITNVMGLQAGIRINQETGDLVIRGGGGDQTAFMIDGNILRDERNNKSYLGISLSSIEDVQIQTGGFNAEYGNVRSGLVNVITKEGSPSRYTVSVISRYHAPIQKHFGPSPNDPNSYWMRPYLDPTVAFVGTGQNYDPGAWDKYTRDQYPYFEGWNSVARKTLLDNDPNNDLTPKAAQNLFLWQHRRVVDITKPDYDVDASFGGPVPYGEQVGNMRFFASYRRSNTEYLVPLNTDNFLEENLQLKVTSDIAKGMKLTVEGLRGTSYGTNDNNSGLEGVYTTPGTIASSLTNVSYIDARIFAPDYWAPTTIVRKMIGAKFTHLLSPHTFYEVSSNIFATSSSTNPGRARNLSRDYVFGNADSVDEGPYGFTPFPSFGVGGDFRMSVGFSNSRDTSKVTVSTSRFDLTSQIDRYNQLKAGAEFIYIDNNVNYGTVDVFLPNGRSTSVWHTFPKRAALYVQDKLEYEGMIANLGLRWDYSYAGGYWYTFNPFSKAFTGDQSGGLDTLLQHAPTAKITNLSPRLGVSFPVTDNSKLYFNYGHFYSMPSPENLFLIRKYSDNQQVARIANPNNPLPRTVAYELGYEQNIYDQFLLHLAGYYKNISDESRLNEYTSKDGKVDYYVSTPALYEDIRGFEVSLTKNRGEWVTGFLNYTYEVTTSGGFGFVHIFESNSDNQNYQNNITNIQNDLYQTKPVPRPFGRGNIDLYTPKDFGPKAGFLRPLGDWRLSLLGQYRAGSYFTWAGGGATAVQGLQNNVEWKDYYNLDLRVSKMFSIGSASIEVFMDATNVLNIKTMNYGDYATATSASVYGFGFKDQNDFTAYMKSLHLPSEIADKLQYGNIPGDDAPGDYRDFSIDFVPMVSVDKIASVQTSNIVTKALYYDQSTGKYMRYANSQWAQADQGRVDQLLKDKAYIDMPNLSYFTFLNPRSIFWGVRLTFDL
jgi:hypothetical protein